MAFGSETLSLYTGIYSTKLSVTVLAHRATVPLSFHVGTYEASFGTSIDIFSVFLQALEKRSCIPDKDFQHFKCFGKYILVITIHARKKNF